jgi:hypothetical protein
LLRDGVPVKQGDRIADIDPRGNTEDLNHISDKSRRVAEGVHEALLGLIAEMERRRPGGRKKPAAKKSKKRVKPTPSSRVKATAKKGVAAEKTVSKPKPKTVAKPAAKSKARGARRSTKG